MLKFLRCLLSLFLILNILYASKLPSELQKANSLYIHHKYKQAIKIYKKLAKKGNAAAINNLAMMYYNAQGTPYKQGTSVRLLEGLIKSKKDTALSDFNLAMMYYNGYVDEKTSKMTMDRKKALYYFKLSAKKGNKLAKKIVKHLEKVYETNSTKPKKK